MIGKTISHYEVLEKLGEGGMGVVYKARDLRLGRFVAIKVLGPGAHRGDRRERFLQEARAASSLNHPNIITIHEIVSSGDSTVTGAFQPESIVMEFVNGVTLADLLHQRPLPVTDAARIGTQIAAAVAAAHSIGIVHRDLKPANVMVTEDGLAKVLDFGLAKLAAADDGAVSVPELRESESTRTMHLAQRPKTTEGTIIGTVAYMSPEQAQGKAVDGRSDIFSFGAVLYEMVTGERAFHGGSSLATLTAVLRDDPRPFAEGLGLPPELEQIILHCLRKEPKDRFQSMAEVRDELDRLHLMLRSAAVMSVTQMSGLLSTVWRPPQAAVTPSIAVLPFLNLSSDKENEYFSDGLAEEIINALTRLGNIRVTARTSAFAFRDERQDVKQIGSKLGVAHVLEGSVRKSGNRVRISVQLIGVESGNNLWSERFDREMTDVFEIQDEISQVVAGTLRVRLSSQSGTDLDPARPVAQLVKRYTENLEAYDLYLKARFELYKMTREGLDAAERLFGEAIKLDPNYAMAYDGLAYTLFSRGLLGFSPATEAMPKARTAVRRAIELDASLADAHATLGAILALHDQDWVAAEREFLLAISLNGASPASRDMYAFFFLRPAGRIEEAIAETQQALSLDPLSILFRVHLGFLFYLERNYEHAIAQFRKVLEISPDYYLGHAMLGQVYTVAGDYARAFACYEKAQSADADSRFVESLQAMTLAAARRVDEARKLEASIEARMGTEYISPVSLAYVFTFLGDRDAAFEKLEQGLAFRDPNILGLNSNPIFDSLREDPRYTGLLRKMRLIT